MLRVRGHAGHADAQRSSIYNPLRAGIKRGRCFWIGATSSRSALESLDTSDIGTERRSQRRKVMSEIGRNTDIAFR